MGMDGERESGKSVLSAWFDYEDDGHIALRVVYRHNEEMKRHDTSFYTDIYIYIVIHRQTISLYHNSSVWLNTDGSRSWDRNLADTNANPRFYHTATRKPA